MELLFALEDVVDVEFGVLKCKCTQLENADTELVVRESECEGREGVELAVVCYVAVV